MMPRILVIKTGTTLPSLLAAQGDFEDWVISGLDVPSDQVEVVDVRADAPLPAPRDVVGVVITGSHSMVTDHAPWSERTAAWLREPWSDARRCWAFAMDINCWLMRWAAKSATIRAALKRGRSTCT